MRRHMDFYLKPYPCSFKDKKLRVYPDIFPDGSIKIDKVWINGKEYNSYEADQLIVNLAQTY